MTYCILRNAIMANVCGDEPKGRNYEVDLVQGHRQKRI